MQQAGRRLEWRSGACHPAARGVGRHGRAVCSCLPRHLAGLQQLTPAAPSLLESQLSALRWRAELVLAPQQVAHVLATLLPAAQRAALAESNTGVAGLLRWRLCRAHTCVYAAAGLPGSQPATPPLPPPNRPHCSTLCSGSVATATTTTLCSGTRYLLVPRLLLTLATAPDEGGRKQPVHPARLTGGNARSHLGCNFPRRSPTCGCPGGAASGGRAHGALWGRGCCPR